MVNAAKNTTTVTVSTSFSSKLFPVSICNRN